MPMVRVSNGGTAGDTYILQVGPTNYYSQVPSAYIAIPKSYISGYTQATSTVLVQDSAVTIVNNKLYYAGLTSSFSGVSGTSGNVAIGTTYTMSLSSIPSDGYYRVGVQFNATGTTDGRAIIQIKFS